MSKFKTRNFKAILYPEDETHLDAISTICNGGYNYALILHDQDTWSENDPSFNPEKHIAGERKKEHFHVVLTFRNPIWSTSLSNELGIADNYLQPAHNIDTALEYLIHFGSNDKYQYDLELVQGPLRTKLEKMLIDETEDDRVQRLIELIENTPSPSYLKLLKASCRAGLYGDFRRMGAFAIKMILEELHLETND